MAALADAPIVCTRAQASHRLRLRSWDRFEIPLPLARVDLKAEALTVPTRGEEESATAGIASTLERLALGRS